VFKKIKKVWSAPEFSGVDFDYKEDMEVKQMLRLQKTLGIGYDNQFGCWIIYEIFN
jgi:hypothetical protein